MFSKSTLIAGTVLALSTFACAEDNRTQTVVYAGGHDASRLVQVQPKSAAPYALTGSEATTKATRVENIWVGSRFAGVRVIQK